MKRYRIGLIGSGYIGRAHSIALQEVGAVFPDVATPVCEILADRDAASAAKSAAPASSCPDPSRCAPILGRRHPLSARSPSPAPAAELRSQVRVCICRVAFQRIK